MEDRVQTLAQLRQSNAEGLAELHTQGIAITELNVLFMRLNLLLDSILSEEDRVEFEIVFESQMAQIIAHGRSQATQMRLLQGVPNAAPPNSLILPK